MEYQNQQSAPYAPHASQSPPPQPQFQAQNVPGYSSPPAQGQSQQTPFPQQQEIQQAPPYQQQHQQPQYQQPQYQQQYQQPQQLTYPSPQDQLLQPRPAPTQNFEQHQAPRDMQPQYAQGTNVHSQEWQNGMCDCSPCENCLLGTFLPCMLLGRTAERMRDPSMQSYESINSDCLLMCGISYFTGCGWIYAMMKRSEIRERFGIAGDGCSDCCASYWCTCCILIQQEKEVVARTAQGPTMQGYTPQPGMHMPAPQAQSPPPKN